MLTTCMHMRQLEVCGCEPLFYPDHHPFLIFDLWKKLQFLFFFSQKVIIVLIVLELHKPFWVHVCLTPTPLLLWKVVCESYPSFAPLSNHVVVPSLKFFLMVPVYIKYQEFASFFPNYIIIACVLAIQL
jgi:hypothetical protein